MQQSKQCIPIKESGPKEINMVSLIGKLMASILRDRKGILFISYPEGGRLKTEEYFLHSNLLKQLNKRNCEKRLFSKQKI